MNNRAHLSTLAFTCLMTFAALSAASAADITVTDARIFSGKLAITGKTASPNTWVRLDGQTDADFNLKSGADGQFAFGIIYHPGDCIVDLQKLVSPTTLGASTSALVADCGPAGVTARGAWNQAAEYAANDLATYEGSTWRARRENSHRQPAQGADWDIFAAGASASSERADGSGVEPLATPSGPAGGDLTGTYPNPTIKDGAITTAKIVALSIGSGRLASNAVTTPKIADDAVTADKILDGSITNADLGVDSVQAIQIADDSIDGSEIIDNSLTATDLAAGSIGNSELANNAVDGSKISDGSVRAADIAGADRTGAISFSRGAHTCGTLNLAVSGALPGDVVVMSLTGNVALSSYIVLSTAYRVTAANTIVGTVCNLSDASISVSNLGVRVMTFR